MSDIMRPIPFRDLLDWVLTEYKKNRSILDNRDSLRAGGRAEHAAGAEPDCRLCGRLILV